MKKYRQLSKRINALEEKAAAQERTLERLLGVTTSAVNLATSINTRVEVLEQRPGEITAEPYHR
ncbi:hypothetical protein ASZ90_016984 [hydrocarbon metagenome]|uniref:Uncharacterized protein n=1 Tax=hydrocarbon metagenome TaxID=938273 RepID=A0A0W8EA97_9ZZZZ